MEEAEIPYQSSRIQLTASDDLKFTQNTVIGPYPGDFSSICRIIITVSPAQNEVFHFLKIMLHLVRTATVAG
jgi:predicted urease superfamily metal-dependent hydrolase